MSAQVKKTEGSLGGGNLQQLIGLASSGGNMGTLIAGTTDPNSAAGKMMSMGTQLFTGGGLGKTASQIGSLASDAGSAISKGVGSILGDNSVDPSGIGSQFNSPDPNAPSLMGRGEDGAMSRALGKAQQNPNYLIQQGLNHLNDPSIANSVPYHVYIGAVEPLLRAKHGMSQEDQE